MVIETQPRTITINRMDVIEKALRCPPPAVADPEAEIDHMQECMSSVTKMSPVGAEAVLNIANDVLTDIWIARKRAGFHDPLVSVRNIEKDGREIDPTIYALTYTNKLSKQLRNMSENGTSNMAMVIASQITERLSEYNERR